jgi:hypothetical protein
LIVRALCREGVARAEDIAQVRALLCSRTRPMRVLCAVVLAQRHGGRQRVGGDIDSRA